MRNAAVHNLPLVIGILALGCLALLFVPDAWQARLAYEHEAILNGEIWRLWTGHWVHFSARHAVMDITVLLLVGAVAEREFGPRFTALGIIVGAPLISLGLMLSVPDLETYRGTSALTMLFIALAGTSLWQTRPKLRVMFVFLGLALAMKMSLDASGARLNLTGLPSDVQVAWQAHILGFVLGWLMFLISQSTGRLILGQGQASLRHRATASTMLDHH